MVIKSHKILGKPACGFSQVFECCDEFPFLYFTQAILDGVFVGLITMKVCFEHLSSFYINLMA